MFTPNLTGQLKRSLGYDIHGRALYRVTENCRFAVINAKQQSEKTSVRADSSASRGSSDEITTGLGRILIGRNYDIEIGDLFSFDGLTYDVKSKHIRRAVSGLIDHFECDIEVRP